MRSAVEGQYQLKLINELQIGETYQLINNRYVITAFVGVSKIVGLLHQFQPFTLIEKDKSFIGNEDILKISSQGIIGYIRIKESDNCLFE